MRLCDLALFSPETTSGVRTYITNKIEYVRTHPEISSHVVILPGREHGDTMQGRSRVITVRSVPSFYPGIYIGINLFKIAELIESASPDLIEVNCQYTLAWAAFLATRRRRIPIVGVYHTDVPACVAHMADATGGPAAKIAERIVEFYEGLLYRHFTLTIALNNGVLPRLRRMGVTNVEVLPCGVDVGTFNPAQRDSDFRARLGISPEKKILIYAGRLSAEKEVDVLIHAHQRLPAGKFVLLIAGDGPDAETIRAYAASRNDVIYLGHFDSPAELARVYASSDVFVIPSRYETFGMAALEALACGLPVVAIGGGGTAGFMSADIGLTAAPGDADDLAEKIGLVAEWDKDRTRDVSRSFASKHYSWDVVFDRYFEIYRKMTIGSS